MAYKLIEKGKSDDGTYTAKQLAEKLHVPVSTIYSAARNHAVVRECLILKVRTEGEPEEHRRKCRACGRWFMGKRREYFCLHCSKALGVGIIDDDMYVGRMLL